jgi:hypothetical protein
MFKGLGPEGDVGLQSTRSTGVGVRLQLAILGRGPVCLLLPDARHRFARLAEATEPAAARKSAILAAAA